MGRSPDAAIFAFSFLLPAGGGGGGGVAHFRVVSDCQTLPLSHISRRHFSYTVCVSYAQKAKGRREKDDNKSLRFSGSLLLLGRGTVYAAAACELDGKGGGYTYIAKNGNGRQTKTGLHGAAEEKKGFGQYSSVRKLCAFVKGAAMAAAVKKQELTELVVGRSTAASTAAH